MSTTRPRVLFISHSASRNGATILLLSFLRWLKDRVDWDIEVLVHGRGPLLDEFRAIGKTIVWRDPGPVLNTLFPRKFVALRRVLQVAHTRVSLPSGRFDLIYASTTAVAPLVRQLAGRARSLVWHVHELTYAMMVTLTRSDWVACFRSATRFIAASNAVREALIIDQKIDADHIEVVNDFIDPQYLSPDIARAKRQQLRHELGIPSDAFVVGACGSLGWRKGSDVFLQIARQVASALGGESVFFVWIGCERGAPATIEFEHDMRHLGLVHQCRLVPTTPDFVSYFPAMDLFALTSREDPFPLVMLEAAELALPILCFEGAGGASEFIEDDCGLRVGYLNIEGFAKGIIQLRDDRAGAMRLGDRARLKVREGFRVECQAPKLLQSMQRCLAELGDVA